MVIFTNGVLQVNARDLVELRRPRPIDIAIFVPTLTYGHEVWVMTERARYRCLPGPGRSSLSHWEETPGQTKRPDGGTASPNWLGNSLAPARLLLFGIPQEEVANVGEGSLELPAGTATQLRLKMDGWIKLFPC